MRAARLALARTLHGGGGAEVGPLTRCWHPVCTRVYPYLFRSLLGVGWVDMCKKVCDALAGKCVGFYVSHVHTRCDVVGEGIAAEDATVAARATGAGPSDKAWVFSSGRGATGSIAGTNNLAGWMCYKKKSEARARLAESKK